MGNAEGKKTSYVSKFIKYCVILVLAIFAKSVLVFGHADFIGGQVFVIACLIIAPFLINDIIQIIKNEFISIDKERTLKNDKYLENIQNANSAIDVMKFNLNQISDYYVINKRQANIAFAAAIVACIVGFILIAIGVLLIFFGTNDALNGVIVGVSGVVSEIVATLFLVVYNKTISQINFFYNSLNEKERFLTVIEMAKDLGDNKEQTIIKIIETSLGNVISGNKSDG